MSTHVATRTFQVSGLALAEFEPLFALSDLELVARGMQRVIADSNPGFPCRASLVDAQVGESLILLNYLHHDVSGPYRASGPIYVREQAVPVELTSGEVPEVARHRLLSLRAYDANGMLRDADVVEGSALPERVTKFFADPDIAYLHAHNARPGCYSCRIDRVRE